MQELLTQAKWRVSSRPGVSIETTDWETSRSITAESSGWVVVRTANRDQQAAWEFAGRDVEAVERYLTRGLGRSVRSARKLPRLVFPRTADAVAPGFVVGRADIADGLQMLSTKEGARVGLTRDYSVGVAQLVQLSHHFTLRIETLIASYLDPDGGALAQFCDLSV